MSRDEQIHSEPVAIRFGQNLQSCRKGAGFSQRELGELAFLHPSAIGMLERGKRLGRIDTVIRLADTLGIPVTDLLEGIEWTPGSRFEIHPHNPPQKGLGKAIEVLRQSKQMSSAELAARSVLDKRELEGVEQGRRELNWTEMHQVAAALDVPFPKFCKETERLDSELGSRPSSKPLKNDS